MLNDSLHSIIIAQVMGFYLLIVAIIMLARAPYYRAMMTNLKSCNHAIMVGAAFSLIIGIFLVIVHNIWIWESEVMITVIGWLILIKSILWLALPERMMTFSNKLYSGAGYYVAAAITGILGILLLSHGFYLFIQ